MYRAEQKLEVAQRELASARDAAKQAKRKVASVERDGASLHDAMQLGQPCFSTKRRTNDANPTR